jgi:hypothetical protein
MCCLLLLTVDIASQQEHCLLLITIALLGIPSALLGIYAQVRTCVDSAVNSTMLT